MDSPTRLLPLALLALTLLLGQAAAETFGTGSGEPLPNVTQVEVYNASFAGENLVDSGINKTFQLNQSRETRYRFEFKIVNDGNEQWPINESDTLYHDGLDTNWDVGDIWYNISQKYETGTFSAGKISWNTSKGGVLDPGEEMYAKYVVNISGDSNVYSQEFKVNDTNESAGSTDSHQLELNRLGFLNVTLQEPPNETVLQQNRSFTVNATIKCEGGECGTVDATPRYNATQGQELIPGTSSKPFYITSTGENRCRLNTTGEKCYVNWEVNATGEKETWHEIDVNASSSFAKVEENSSQTSPVKIDVFVLMDLSWDRTEFGKLNVGDTEPARNNSDLLYNITIDEYSADVSGLWLKGKNLVSQQINEYEINISRVNYSFQNDSATSSPLSKNYQRTRSDIKHGTTLTTFYWLDVPYGMEDSDYEGNLTWKANTTG